MSVNQHHYSQRKLFDPTPYKNTNQEKYLTGKKGKVTFKPYDMNQLFLLPPSLDELIPPNHLVRVINDTIDKIDIEPLLMQYKGGGTSSYHPKMMLKVLVYAYSQKIYSSRQIAKALRENIFFMWLSGNNRPDFRTINRFRSSTMKNVIDDVFIEILTFLIEEGYVKLENYFLDGTKIEANANKYSWVWGKSTKKYHQKLQENIKKLLAEIEQYNEAENQVYGDRDLEELGNESTIDSEKITEAAKRLDEKLKKRENNETINPEELADKVKELEDKLTKEPNNKHLRKVVNKLRKDYLPRCKKYEEQMKILNGRNSYSKTDPDATFMRMKEDRMKNGQLKPGYNVQIGTENQFIVWFSVHQKPGDATCLIPHLKELKEKLGGRLPKNIIADAGYGSEENYEYLEEEGLGNYVKYNTFHQERKKKYKEAPYRVENLRYNPEKDEYYCPAGKKFIYRKTSSYKTDNGYTAHYRVYEAEDCSNCPQKTKCTKAAGNRRIQVNTNLNRHKEKARANLCSEQGVLLCPQRGVEVEPVYGTIKQNRGFRRFLLRGLKKVKIEWGIVSIAHNLSKMAQVKFGVF